jgi:hypothetical protein
MLTSSQRRLLATILALLRASIVCHSQQIPSNDRCIAATQLLPDVPIQGSNANANFDFNNQAVCGPRSDRRAVWYSITGNGNPFTAHLCSNDDEEIVNFGVFRECNSQNCQGFPDVDLANLIFKCEDDVSQPYSWLAEVGSRYFFHVRGPEEGANFSFIVDDDGGAAPNDSCDEAEILPVPGTVKSTTEGATHDFLSPDFCGKLSNHAGVWYKILGDGRTHTHSLCSLEEDDNIAVDFGLFSECGTRSCIGFPEKFRLAKCADNDAIEFNYRSEIGVPYYVHVRGELDSRFALRTVTEIDSPGDSCMDAAEIRIGETASGNTANATFDFVDENACGPKSDLPGVW